MNTYDITPEIEDETRVPLCPLCDQPIYNESEAAIGERVTDVRMICLIHDRCGKFGD